MSQDITEQKRAGYILSEFCYHVLALMSSKIHDEHILRIWIFIIGTATSVEGLINFGKKTKKNNYNRRRSRRDDGSRTGG